MFRPPGGPTLDFVREVRAEQLKRKRERRAAAAGQNLAQSIAGITMPFPWEKELRAFSPIVEKVSHLRSYWYAASSRWVLYECIPLHLMPSDERKVRPDLTGEELHAALKGKPPRHRSDDEDPSPISDVQHEFARLFGVWAGPLVVLQGQTGGHLCKYHPWQQNVLIAKGLSAEAPAIGSLPPCPFDQRTIAFLNRMNRLHKLGNRLDALQKSGSAEAAAVEMEGIQREIREAEMALVEANMTPLVEMSSSLRSKSADQDQLIHVPGQASRAKDAYAQYKETGDFTMKFTQ